MHSNLYNLSTIHRAKSAIETVERHGSWLFICSSSIALHSIRDSINYRRIKDLDIYLVDCKEHRKRIPYETKIIKGTSVLDFSSEEKGVILDIFSNGYLADTLTPITTDIRTSEIGGEMYRHSSIEHSLMLKLLTTCRFRLKELSDILFILNSFEIDETRCQHYFAHSKYRKILDQLPSINPSNIERLIKLFQERILNEYMHLESVIDVGSIPYEYLVTLLNYDHFSITKDHEKLLDIFNDFLLKEKSTHNHRQLYLLGALYFSYNNSKHSDGSILNFLCKIYNFTKAKEWPNDPMPYFSR